MNITSINAEKTEDLYSSTKSDTTPNKEFEQGEVVEGVITKVSDQISINFSGKEVTVSKSTVQNATEGEIRKFKIMDVSNQSIVLKEVGSSTHDTSSMKATWTNIETFKGAFLEYQTALEEKQQEEQDQAKEKLKDAANRLTSKDYEALVKEGKYLEAYNLVRLDRAIDRIKEQRDIKEEGVKKQVENDREYRRDIERTGHKNQSSKLSADEISKSLEEANLPATKSNISRVANAFELGQSVYSMSDKSMGYLIGNDLSPTIENVYKASYSSNDASKKPLSEEEWKSIEPQAEKVMKEAGFEVNEQSKQDAKWLLDNELPLTKDSLTKLNDLRNLKNSYDDEKLLDNIVTAISKGIDPAEASLDDGVIQIAKQTVEDVNKISDAAIIKVANENKEINLENLKKAQEELSKTSDTTFVDTKLQEVAKTNEVDIKAITAKRQLEEIRLKMTVEAAAKLQGKGFSIDTESLEKVVEELRNLEDNYYRSILKESNTLDSRENVNLLKETTERVAALRSMPSYVLGKTLSGRDATTINDLHEEGTALKSQLAKANESYDALMTSPKKDLGDSIQKAFRNVDQILEDMNLPITNANQRAVKILGYNSMEITNENIESIKEYDAKVNELINNLKPQVTVNLIKEGVNPLNTPIDELNDLTEQIKDEIGVSEDEKYSEYLWKLQKQDGITENERKSYIGIYRLLNNIQKAEGAAIGSVIHAGQEMTLGNLLTAVRTMKSNGIDQTVDDQFGMLEQLTFSKETITDQIASTLEENTESVESAYQKSLVKNIMNEVTPSKVSEIAKKHNILGMTLESLKEELAVAKDDNLVNNAYYEEKVNEIRNLATASDDAISFLGEFQLPSTIENVAAAQAYLQSNGSSFKKILEKTTSLDEDNAKEVLDEVEGLLDSFEDNDTMSQKYQKIDESVSNILNKQLENHTITSKDISDLKALRSSMNFVKQLSNKEYYEIPLAVNGSITNINLTVVNQGDETGKITMKVDSKELGAIEAEFSVKNEEVKGYILSESKDTLNALKANTEVFSESVSNFNITINQLDYGTSKKIETTYIARSNKNKVVSNTSNNTESHKATTKQLYQVAKALVLNIKAIEMDKASI